MAQTPKAAPSANASQDYFFSATAPGAEGCRDGQPDGASVVPSGVPSWARLVRECCGNIFNVFYYWASIGCDGTSIADIAPMDVSFSSLSPSSLPASSLVSVLPLAHLHTQAWMYRTRKKGQTSRANVKQNPAKGDVLGVVGGSEETTTVQKAKETVAKMLVDENKRENPAVSVLPNADNVKNASDPSIDAAQKSKLQSEDSSKLRAQQMGARSDVGGFLLAELSSNAGSSEPSSHRMSVRDNLGTNPPHSVPIKSLDVVSASSGPDESAVKNQSVLSDDTLESESSPRRSSPQWLPDRIRIACSCHRVRCRTSITPVGKANGHTHTQSCTSTPWHRSERGTNKLTRLPQISSSKQPA